MASANERQRRQRDTGALFQRGDGKWVGTVDLPPHPDGRRRRKQIVRKTKREAEQALKALRNEKLIKGDIRTVAPKVGEWVGEWIDAREASGKLRPSTARAYRSYLNARIKPALGRIRVDKLTPAQVEGLTSSMVASGASPTSAVQVQNILKGALEAAQRKGLVDRNVAKLAEAPETAHHEAEVLPLDEANSLLWWASQQDAVTHVRIFLALLAGLRQSEALGLTRSSVDLERNVIFVKWQLQQLDEPPAKSLAAHHLTGRYWLTEPKSKAGSRTVPIIPPLRAALERRMVEMGPDPWETFVVNSEGGPLDHSRDRRNWMSALKSAGVRRVRLHDARHTTATIMRARGIESRLREAIMGHSSSTMADHYAHIASDETVLAMAMFGDAFQIEAPKS